MTMLRQAAQQLIYRIDREGASPLDWPEYDALLTALGQPEQEPVAERFEAMHSNRDVWITTIAAAQIARSTTPPAAQRKPLTNEEITKAFNEAMAKRPKDASNAETNRLFVRAVEAAHGIKEGV